MAQGGRESRRTWGWTLPLLAFALAFVAQPATAPATGGPDGGLYQWVDSTAPGTPVPYAFVDIAANGTIVTGLGDDNQVTINLPFTTFLYDVTTSQVQLASNGYLCFQASSCSNTGYTYSGTPSSSAPNTFVAAFLKDLNCTTAAPACKVTTASWGTAPERVFAIQLTNQKCWSGTCLFTYQFKVSEAGWVEVHYAAMADSSASSFSTAFAGTEGRTSGGTYTGLQYLRQAPNAAAAALSNKAIRYVTTAGPPGPPPPCASGGPANDCFAAATVVAGDTFTTTQSTVGALTEAGEPTPGWSVSKSVWFQWTPTTSGSATVSTCGPPAASYDTVLGVYTGSAITGLTLVAGNDQACGNQSTVSFPCVAGTTYHVQASSWSSTAAGTLRLSMSCHPPCTEPPNDCFGLPTVAMAYPDPFTFAGSNAGATLEPGEPTSTAGFNNGRSVWFDWVAPGPGTATARTCGSSFDTVLAVYTGTAVTALTQVVANDDAVGVCGLQSQVTWTCQAGTRYRIQVLGYNGAQGPLAFTLSGCPPDADGDGHTDAADNCPESVNFAQEDLDLDGVGDACDGDLDGDGQPNGIDNCPLRANADQRDLDLDGRGDACDEDGTEARPGNAPPTAVAHAWTACGDLEVRFTAAASWDPDGLVTRWAWSFGDGATAEGVTVSHLYAAAGPYLVQLRVQDDAGAAAEDPLPITLADCPPAAHEGPPAQGPAPAPPDQQPPPVPPPAPPAVPDPEPREAPAEQPTPAGEPADERAASDGAGEPEEQPEAKARAAPEEGSGSAPWLWAAAGAGALAGLASAGWLAARRLRPRA